jgi:hypothetical protein
MLNLTKELHMKKLMIMTAALATLAGAAHAADVTGKVKVDFAQDVNDNAYATTEMDLGFKSATQGDGFIGGLGLKVESDNGDNIALDSWNLGYKFGDTTVSFGDQGDLFDFGGLEVVGGETMQNPADGQDSLIVTHKNYSAMIGFTDIGTDLSEVENAQLSYAGNVGPVATVASVDYNFNTDLTTVGVSGTAQVAEKTTVGLAVTYADYTAYEATIGYNDFTAYLNGDEHDTLQNVGFGYSAAVQGADVYVELGYNLDSEEFTPAAGVSIKF